MKSEEQLKKWLVMLNRTYEACGSSRDLGWGTYVEERTRLEIEIETLQKVLDIDKGSFEPLAELELN